MNRSILVVIVFTALFWLQGCGLNTEVRIPSDTPNTSGPVAGLLESHPCQPENDGTREGYHYPGDSVWFPDCDNSLSREYWRVFLESDKHAYIIPRPDAAPELKSVCADENHELRTVVDQYRLCEAAAGTIDVELINNMLPADALKLAHYLHSQLRFRVLDNDSAISPFPISTDIVDACQLHTRSNSAALNELCERELERIKSGHEIGFTYSGEAASELAELLNELYDIPSPN